jgi:hypothetical protein
MDYVLVALAVPLVMFGVGLTLASTLGTSGLGVVLGLLCSSIGLLIIPLVIAFRIRAGE